MNVLIVEDDRGWIETLEHCVRDCNLGFRSVVSPPAARKLIEEKSFEFSILICDWIFKGAADDDHGIDLVEDIKADRHSHVYVVMATIKKRETHFAEASQRGVDDFWSKSNEPQELAILKTLLINAQQVVVARQNREPIMALGSDKMRQLKRLAQQIGSAPGRNNHVLITGATGTGKESFASLIHESGPRRAYRYVTINSAAVSEQLAESELFGHVKGAFTGADSHRMGKFELADGGTLFLDEVGDFSLSMQAKLLRAIELGEIAAVGSTTNKNVNVRIVSATNRDLAKMVQERTFRRDLWCRLKVFHIHLPSIAERPDDILPLAEYFLEVFATSNNRQQSLTKEARTWLEQQPWDGNIRDIRDLMRRCSVLAPDLIDVPDLKQLQDPQNPGEDDGSLPCISGIEAGFHKQRYLDIDSVMVKFEKRCMIAALRVANGNQTVARDMLTMKSGTWRHRFDTYREEDPEFAAQVDPLL